MKAWLKGGLIGMAISFFIGSTIATITIMFSLMAIGNSHATFPPIIQLFFKLNAPFLQIAAQGVRSGEETFFLMFALPAIFYLIGGFILGSVIGWIIGKIKSRA